MKKCSSFSQNRKLVVVIVRGAFFIVEKVLPKKCASYYDDNTSEVGP